MLKVFYSNVLMAVVLSSAWAQVTERTGRTIGVGNALHAMAPQIQELDETLREDLLEIEEDIETVNSAASLIESEILRLQEYVQAFQPREEKIAVTVYNNVYAPSVSTSGDDGGLGSSSGGGDDGGGDGGSGGGGDGGGGGSGTGGGSAGGTDGGC